MNNENFGPVIIYEVTRVKNGKTEKIQDRIATEIPFTILANEVELVTLLCSPSHLQELTCGYLYTSGFIRSAQEIRSYTCDTVRWVAYVEIENTPDPDWMTKRLYTAGCGRGVMYTNLNEITNRRPLQSTLSIEYSKIFDLSRWLQQSSSLYRSTGAVHTAALSDRGAAPSIFVDDIGRHNAVDKVIGMGLLKTIDFSRMILISSGRTSSEILHKARKCGIAMTISRGAPTHQTILLAKEMGITVVGFARGGYFNIYSHEERIQETTE